MIQACYNKYIKYTKEIHIMESGRHSHDNTPKSRYFLLGLTFFLAGAALITLYYIMFRSTQLANVFGFVSNILSPIILGFILAYITTPILNFIESRIVVPLFKKCKSKTEEKKDGIRALSVAFTAVFFVLLVYSFIHLFIAQIVPSIKEIIENFDIYTNNIIAYVNNLLEDNPSLREYFNNLIESYSSDLQSWLNNSLLPQITTIVKSVSLSVISVLAFLWDFVIGFILSIYILFSKDIFANQAKKLTYSLFEKERANNILADSRFIHKTFIGFLSGKVIDSAIIGVICFIGTSILGTPYAALVSLIIGVTNIIPFFGPFLGAIPCSVLIFVVTPMQPLNTVYFVIFILLLQQFDGNILGPKILGDSTGLSSFWVIFAITIFGGIFGVAGMVIGVPTFAVLYAASRRFINKRLKCKGLPIERDLYENISHIDEENHMVARTPELENGPKKKKWFRINHKQ